MIHDLSEVFSGFFSPNVKYLGMREHHWYYTIGQYETLQYAVIYLLQTRENNLKVHKMVANIQSVTFLPKPNLGSHTVHALSFYL